MEKDKTERIGKVALDYTRYPGEDFYCDGATEDILLDIVKNEPRERYPDVIREKCSWEVLYHLSDLRENIVEWLPMDKGMKVLEVGSGCGAITGSLAKKAGSVTCVDLSRKRSLINAWRHKDCDNITIHVGNFQDIEPDLPVDYDYVCLIGAFEYGQSYINTDTPFTDYYRIVKKHVKPGGRIVIAIENKMGLKYWAGCREDHLGTFFSGLEDYSEGGAVRTFSRKGLEEILKTCGETDYHFYYPYPDYKFMTMIYSDRYLPKVGELSNNLRNFDRDRMLLFDEKKVFDMLIRENLFPLFSNSYLVVTGPKPQTVYSRFSNDRARHLCIRTDIGEKEEGKKYVRKYPANEQAEAHIHVLAKNCRIFTARFSGSTLQVNRLEEKCTPDGRPFAELEFLENATTLEELLDDCLQKNDEAGFGKLFDRYREILSWNVEGQPQDFDLIFPNICVQGDTWTMIDYEWTTTEWKPDEIARRAVYCYILENEKRKDHPILQKVMETLHMDEKTIARLAKKEYEFQESVMREKDGRLRTAVTDMRHLIGHKAVPAKEFFAVAGLKKMQVFEDFGNGYSPEHSYYVQDDHLEGDVSRIALFCKTGTKAIRLDPAEEPCIVSIREVTYRGQKMTQKQLERAIVTNGKSMGKSSRQADDIENAGMPSILFDHNDPNINVRLDVLENPEGGRREHAAAQTDGQLFIELQVARLSPRMLEDVRAQAARRKRFWFQK